MRKGFYFSFDALMALTIMSASFFVVMQSSDVANDPYSSSEIDYRKSTTTGQDALKLASEQRFTSYFNDSYRQELVDNTVMESDDMDRTIVDGIALMWAAENKSYAKKTAKKYFESKVPERYGYRVQVGETSPENVLYNTTEDPNSSVVTSTSRLVSGHALGKPSEGYQARTSLSSVTKEETKTRFFGGYVGDGRITYNVSLSDLHTVLNVTTEGDFSGPFDLYINGQESGSYIPNHENLSASYFTVCTDEQNEQRCEALNPGNNMIEYRFTENNQSIGGGLIKITYNRTTTIQPPGTGYQQKRKRLPGIDGVINYYGGSYVPGDVKGANARLHYETDNQTFFVRIGNSTIYEKRTIGEQTVNIGNETIHDNLSSSDYSSLSRETVPIRIGLRNLDEVYDRAIADSVSVMDVSGSMGCSWYEDPPCKIDEAKDASKTFAEIILNASGNRAGFVSYNEDVVDTHNLSENYSSIESKIEDQTEGGNTCIACGILEATDKYENPFVYNIVSKKANWSYTTDYLDNQPPERDGYNWTQENYDDSDWDNGSAIIGAGPNADTELSDYEGSVYLRKKVYTDASRYRDMDLRIRSNDAAAVYVNGVLVSNDTTRHTGKYWNLLETYDTSPMKSAFETGENVIAVKLRNTENDTNHWQIENSSEWDEGTYAGTKQESGQLMLEPESFDGAQQNVEAGDYCSVSGGDTSYGEHIDDIKFKGIDRATGDNSGYIDATDSISNGLIAGSSYMLEITFNTGGYNEYGTVVFDWDGDGSISDNSVKEVGTCSSDGCTVSTQVDVPEDAATGSTLMRVMGEYDGYHKDQCSDPNYNEIEDYSAYVAEPVYGNGTYESKQFDAGEKVEWTTSGIEENITDQTNVEINFSNGSNWYDDISDVPNSQNLRLNLSLETMDNSQTPKVDLTDIGYLVDESYAEFDLSLNGTQNRRRSMIVMSDGEPNEGEQVPKGMECDVDGSDSFYGDDADTIDSAYYAHEEYGSTVYVVGFGSGANEDLLNMTARCGNGTYYYSDTGELENVFRNISNNILDASFVGQTVETSEEAALGQLHPDSHITFNYTDDSEGIFGSIELQQSSERFGGDVESPKNGTFTVPEGVEPVSGRITSYSANRWTDRAAINTSGSMENFYRLWKYGSEYRQLGDPFKIHIPSERIENGVKKVSVDTALDQSNPEGGSPDNKVFYTVRVNGSVGYGSLFENKSFAEKDAKERLDEKLDVDGDGNPDVSTDSDDVDLSSSFTEEQPYVWGPAILKLVVWE